MLVVVPLVPHAPRAVQVTTTPTHLTVSLKWYGRVVDGPLHGRVKPSETHWCLEDSEVSLAAPLKLAAFCFLV